MKVNTNTGRVVWPPTIMSLNVNKRGKQMERMMDIIEDEIRSIIMLQDVPANIGPNKRLRGWLEKYHLIDGGRESVRTTTMAQINGTNGISGRNVILVHKEAPFNWEPLGTKGNALEGEAICVGIKVSEQNDKARIQKTNDDNARTLSAFNIYIRPRAQHRTTRDLLEWIKEKATQAGGLTKIIIIGDMNASNRMWESMDRIYDNKENSEKHYSRIKENRGRAIADFIGLHRLICMNTKHRVPTCGTNTIDLAIVGRRNLDRDGFRGLEVSRDQAESTSDHTILTLKGGTRRTKRKAGKTRTIKMMRLDSIMPDAFVELELVAESAMLEYTRNDTTLKRRKLILDKLTELTYETIGRVQEKITTIRQIRNNGTGRGFEAEARQRTRLRSLNRAIKRTILELKSAQEQNRRFALRKRLRGYRVNKSSIINRKLKVDSRMELWQRIRAREKSWLSKSDNRPMGVGIGTRADLSKIAKTKFPAVRRMMIDGLESELETAHKSGTETRVIISDEEIKQAYKEIANKQYTSPTGIKMPVFIRCLEFIEPIIRIIIRGSFETTHIPAGCDMTKGTLIPKKGKKAFRIVHVSNPIAAILENIALHRLEHELERGRLISMNQFGFTPGRGRHDLVARVMELCASDGNWENGNGLEHMKESTMFSTIVSMDIEGAFDNIDQDALVQKLIRELDRADGLRYWLAAFILNRRIVLEFNGIRSKTRRVERGVPQGSALGPCLFNYATNQIESRPETVGKERLDLAGFVTGAYIEVLKYADDIMLVQRGYNGADLQIAIDKLTRNLESIQLRVNPEKSAAMAVKLGLRSKSYHRLGLQVNGAKIKIVKEMNILGITIDNRLCLSKKPTSTKIKKAAQRLSKLVDMDIIHEAKEWRILADSLIMSQQTINNWPVLATKKENRSWMDAQFTKAMRIIFNWPNNTNNNTIRLIMDQQKCTMLVNRLIRIGQTGELGNTYGLLVALLNKSERNKRAEKVNHLIRPLWHYRRASTIKSANPRQYLDKGHLTTTNKIRLTPETARMIYNIRDKKEKQSGRQAEVIKENIRECGLFDCAPDTMGTKKLYTSREAQVHLREHLWIMIGLRGATIGIEIDDRARVQQRIAIRQSQYPIKYFNDMALLYWLVTNKAIRSRRIALERDNALIRALENNRSRDWRIIKIREKIMEEGWTIVRVAEKNEFELIKAFLIEEALMTDPINNRYNSDMMTKTERPHLELSDYERWDINNSDNVDRNERDKTKISIDDTYKEWCDKQHWGSSKKFLGVELIITTQPDVNEYALRFRIDRECSKDKDMEMGGCMSKIMKEITGNNIEAWQKVTPNWLSGSKILMLGDMVRSSWTGQLCKSDEESRTGCRHCGREPGEWHTALHRLIECSGFKRQRDELERLARAHEYKSASDMMNNRMHAQTMLRLMALVAIRGDATINKKSSRDADE